MNYDEMNPIDYEKRCVKYAREKYIHEHWYPIFKREVEKYCKTGIILDLGYGFGSITELVRKINSNVVGIDIAGKWLSYSKRINPQQEVILADCTTIPLKDNSIDAIVSWGLFEYIDRKITIKEIFRILKNHGICIIHVPNKYSANRCVCKIITKLLGKKYEKNEPSKSEMITLFNHVGFEVIEFKMDDGLIWLPNCIDAVIGKKVYSFLEKVMKRNCENPYSEIMQIVVRKVK